MNPSPIDTLHCVILNTCTGSSTVVSQHSLQMTLGFSSVLDGRFIVTTRDGWQVQVTYGVPHCQSSPRRTRPLASWGVFAAIHLDLEIVRPSEGVSGLRVERESLARGSGQHNQPPPGLGHAIMTSLENLET